MFKFQRRVRCSLVILALSGLSACGGGGSGGDGPVGGINCAAIYGGGTQASPTVSCANCTVSNAGAAIDNDLSTFATLHMPAGASGNIALRATAQNGVVYPAGTPAAVVYGLMRNGGASTSTAQTIGTYLDDAQQGFCNVGNTGGVQGGDEAVGRRSCGTTQPFDAIELNYVQSSGTADVEVQVYEFCTSVN